LLVAVLLLPLAAAAAAPHALQGPWSEDIGGGGGLLGGFNLQGTAQPQQQISIELFCIMLIRLIFIICRYLLKPSPGPAAALHHL
jgi:hypothetical protein